MDLVSVRLESSKRASLLVDLAVVVNPDGQQGRSLAKCLVDAAVGLALVSHRGFESSQQVNEPAVLASEQIEAMGALLTHEEVDVVGRDTGLLEHPHRGLGFVLAVEQTGHVVDEREQVTAPVRVMIDSGHSLQQLNGAFTRGFPFSVSALYTNSHPQ